MESEGPRQRTMWSVVAVLAAVVTVLAVTLVLLRVQDSRPRAEVGAVFQSVFQVPADAVPRVLTVEQVALLRGSGSLPLSARLKLAPVG
ncbi:MAG: hypothetical protein Q8O61_09010 [Nocardioides sp.]|nr:hypothetical protein [Nocardioides sp.]